MAKEHLTLFELNKLIGVVLDAHLDNSYWVIAEIGEIRVHGKGHCYLELVEKDQDNIRAKMRATIWSYTYRNLSAWFEKMTGTGLKQGLNVLVQVSVEFHEVYGLSLNIRDIDAAYTLGERARRRNEIIAKLKEEGVWEMNKELHLPMVPQRIAVISSSTAAGFGDFVRQLEGNAYGYQFHVHLFQATMQGDQAPSSIVYALHQVFDAMDDFDVVVIIRGGGAALDLDCFDAYEVASHIAQFPLPVITGIGHERDETIADLVAHTRLKTPTAVAEFLISGFLAFEEKLQAGFEKLYNKLALKISADREKLGKIGQKLQFSTQQRIQKAYQRIDRAGIGLKYHSQKWIEKQHDKLKDQRPLLRKWTILLIKHQLERIAHFDKVMQISNPKNVLKMGYSLSRYKGKVITDQNLPKQGEIIEIESYHSKIYSQVERIENKNGEL
ncbi:MAG: exodeoxyribonuclease VII large subunit [Cyclobacteriaceae bacterium]|nr:exodeoxyribonuclease VII large subunit [Cyclobacteriaceae bacterium]